MHLRRRLVEREEVVKLEEEDDNPVDARDDAVLCKGGREVLSPNGVLVVVMHITVVAMAVMGGRSVESVVDGRDQEEDVGEGSGDLVDEDGLTGVGVSAGEWVETVTA